MKAQNNEILVIKNEEIIILFISINEKVTEISLSIEKKMNDLIDIYCKEKGIKNNNQTIFLYENENIEKNRKIKELIQEGSNGNYLNIWVFGKENVKTNIEYEGATLTKKNFTLFNKSY